MPAASEMRESLALIVQVNDIPVWGEGLFTRDHPPFQTRGGFKVAFETGLAASHNPQVTETMVDIERAQCLDYLRLNAPLRLAGYYGRVARATWRPRCPCLPASINRMRRWDTC